MPVLVALSCLGAVNGGFFGSTRMIFVGAREGHMPGIFSMIHIRRQTPLPAILFLYPLVVIMIARGEIYELINFASFSRWFFIALATLGMLIHRYRFPEHPRPFKVPLVIAVIFTLVCFFIVGLSLYSDPWNTGLSCGLTLAVVPLYYLTMKTSCIPNRWKKTFNYFSLQLQILLEVTPQEVQTYWRSHPTTVIQAKITAKNDTTLKESAEYQRLVYQTFIFEDWLCYHNIGVVSWTGTSLSQD